MYGHEYPEPPDFDPYADPDEPSEAEPTPGDTWQAVDLAETLHGLQNGTIARLAPTVGRLDDGRALFYRGKVNGIAGASNCGKSWTALLACAQEIDAGSHVVYVDLEDDAAGILERLLDLGADPAVILARFHYVHPDEPYGERAEAHLSYIVEGICAALVVIDSTGESLALDRAKPNDDDDVARWFRRLPTRIARMGPAVVVLDHVVKADEGGLWPIGSQRKRAAISGAQYMQSTVKPFSRDTPGMAKLVCAKDRHGNYRPGQRVADLVMTPDETPTAVLRVHEAPDVAPGDWRPTALMERLAAALATADEPLSFRSLDELVKGKAEHKRTALRVLVDEGHVIVTDGPRNARLHSLVKGYAQREDPRSDLYRPGTHSTDDEPVSVSVSYRRDTGHTHSTVSGTHSGHTRDTVHSEGGEEGRSSVHKGGDLDERPRCSHEGCTAPGGRRLGMSERAAGVCLPCQRKQAAERRAS